MNALGFVSGARPTSLAVQVLAAWTETPLTPPQVPSCCLSESGSPHRLVLCLQFEGGRGAEEIRKFWQNCEHPSINKREWGAQEVDRLKAIAAGHGHLGWQEIAEELGVRAWGPLGPQGSVSPAAGIWASCRVSVGCVSHHCQGLAFGAIGSLPLASFQG